MPPKAKLFDSDDEGEAVVVKAKPKKAPSADSSPKNGGDQPAPAAASAALAALYDDDDDEAGDSGAPPVAPAPKAVKLPPRPKHIPTVASDNALSQSEGGNGSAAAGVTAPHHPVDSVPVAPLSQPTPTPLPVEQTQPSVPAPAPPMFSPGQQEALATAAAPSSSPEAPVPFVPQPPPETNLFAPPPSTLGAGGYQQPATATSTGTIGEAIASAPEDTPRFDAAPLSVRSTVSLPAEQKPYVSTVHQLQQQQLEKEQQAIAASEIGSVAPSVAPTPRPTETTPEFAMINQPAYTQQPPPPPVERLPLPQDEDGVYRMPEMPPPLDFTPIQKPEHFADGDAPAWNAFMALQKQLQDAHGRTMALHQHLSTVQMTHEKEATELRLAYHVQLEHLQKELAMVTDHYTQAQAKFDSLTSTLHRKAQEMMKMEQELHRAQAAKAEMLQRVADVEDKCKVMENARQIAEVRQKELELSLEHSVTLVNSLRKQLYVANDEKLAALQSQYELMEENRKKLIEFYAQREEKLLQNYNGSLRTVQAMTDDHVKAREKEVAEQWTRTVDALQTQYKSLETEVLATAARHQEEKAELQAKADLEREKWISHLKDEMVQMEQRHTQREEQVLTDIARRERELAEREQQHRVTMVKEQQEAKITLMTREAELKAYYEKIVDDLHKAHESDRDKLMAGFRDQVGSLSRQHESNERELERLHREKEREMAQRYRIAGYEVDDVKKQVDMQNVTNKTQSSLLSKFDAAERSQRERAEHSRLALKGTQELEKTAGATGTTKTAVRSSALADLLSGSPTTLGSAASAGTNSSEASPSSPPKEAA